MTLLRLSVQYIVEEDQSLHTANDKPPLGDQVQLHSKREKRLQSSNGAELYCLFCLSANASERRMNIMCVHVSRPHPGVRSRSPFYLGVNASRTLTHRWLQI